MMKKWLVTITAAVVVLSGCAFSNEGAVDFRRADPYDPKELPKVQGTAKIHAVPLSDKDRTSGNSATRIDRQDKISIRLRDGYLNRCNERLRNPLRNFKQNCEIAILFKAFELSATSDFNFKPGSERDARLVYFSKDVQPGQYFNFHNLPVYGPIEYTGKPIGIDVWILEIDAEDQQAVALLRTLASVGAKAYAPAAPILPILDQLGAALLSSGADDVEMRYTMVLDPANGFNGAVYSTAEAGDYVFIREHIRDHLTDWSRLSLDHNTGRVWVRQDGAVNPVPYRENTYLTIQILRNAGTEDVALAQNTYGDFRAAIEKEAIDKADQVRRFGEELEVLAMKRVHIRNFNRLQVLYERMIGRSAGDQALAKQDAFDLYQQLKTAITAIAANDPKKPPDISADQVNAMLSKLRALAKAADEATINKFTQSGFAAMQFDDFSKEIFR